MDHIDGDSKQDCIDYRDVYCQFLHRYFSFIVGFAKHFRDSDNCHMRKIFSYVTKLKSEMEEFGNFSNIETLSNILGQIENEYDFLNPLNEECSAKISKLITFFCEQLFRTRAERPNYEDLAPLAKARTKLIEKEFRSEPCYTALTSRSRNEMAILEKQLWHNVEETRDAMSEIARLGLRLRTLKDIEAKLPPSSVITRPVSNQVSDLGDKKCQESTKPIESNFFEMEVKNYTRDLHCDEENEKFAIPELLRDISTFYFFHDKDKSVIYRSIPRETHFVERGEKTLESIDEIVKRDTRGFFDGLDETTKTKMRNPDFRSLILAILYLKGRWSAIEVKSRNFHNGDGTIAKNVPYIGFENARVTVSRGKLKFNVDYISEDGRCVDRVCFSMPFNDEKDGMYEKCTVLLPRVDLKHREEIWNGTDTTVINYRYQHDENGFTAVCVCAAESSDGGGCTPKRIFVLDKPFDITIYYKNENLLTVRVQNLQDY